MKKIISIILTFALILGLSFSFSASADSSLSFEEYIVSKLASFPDSIDVSYYVSKNGWIPQKAINEFIDVIFNNPQIFYIKTGCGSTQRGSVVKLNQFEYTMPKSQIPAAIKKLKAATKKALSAVTDKMTATQKVTAVHDYLVLNCEYDTTLKNYTAYDCLVLKKAVCQGYTLAFNHLMNELGYQTKFISSKPMVHGWSYLKINKKWYHVDVTSDDPIVGNSDYFGSVFHNFMLVSDKKIRELGHYGWDSSLPSSGNTYDDYFWSDIESAIINYNGYDYYINFDSEKNCGKCKNDPNRITCSQLIKRNSKTGKSAVVYTFDDIWWKDSSKTYYYLGSYSKIALYKKEIYFNTPDTIYKYSPSTGKTKKVFSASIKNGYIYGIKVEDGKIKYCVKTAPTEAGKIYSKSIAA